LKFEEQDRRTRVYKSGSLFMQLDVKPATKVEAVHFFFHLLIIINSVAREAESKQRLAPTYDGLGFPPLEALSMGCAVLVHRTSCLRFAETTSRDAVKTKCQRSREPVSPRGVGSDRRDPR
jgi:hypothetical protein